MAPFLFCQNPVRCHSPLNCSSSGSHVSSATLHTRLVICSQAAVKRMKRGDSKRLIQGDCFCIYFQSKHFFFVLLLYGAVKLVPHSLCL